MTSDDWARFFWYLEEAKEKSIRRQRGLLNPTDQGNLNPMKPEGSTLNRCEEPGCLKIIVDGSQFCRKHAAPPPAPEIAFGHAEAWP